MSRFTVVILAALLALPAAARADSTQTQTLAPGASMSTGSDVSPSDPVQLTVTAPRGGTYTLAKTDQPSSRRHDDVPSIQPAFAGAQFVVAAQQSNVVQPPVTLTFLVDPSIAPMPSGGDTHRDHTVWVCNAGRCQSTGVQGVRDFESKVLANGDVQVTLDNVDVDSPDVQRDDTFDVGHTAWSVTAVGYGTEDLNGALADGLKFRLGCSIACAHRDTAEVSSSVARQLHLKSTKIGSGSAGLDDVKSGYQSTIRFTAAFKRAMRRYRHVAITISSAVTSWLGDHAVTHAHMILKRMRSGSELG